MMKVRYAEMILHKETGGLFHEERNERRIQTIN